MNNPFAGPRPIGQSEPIFGRNREITELRHLLIAERIVLLHSPSGAGKSSLVNAGIIPELKGVFDVWAPTRVNTQPPPEVTTNRYIWSTIDGWKKPGDETTLKEFVTARPTAKNPLLIFDQFEEILRTSPTDTTGQKEFFHQLADLLALPNVWALLVIREEYLAPLLPHFATLPTHLRHRYRLDLLTKPHAETAMRCTAARGGRVFQPEALSPFADRLADNAGFIEPMHLQVVCHELWNKMDDDDLSIDPVDVEKFGNVTGALRAYYDGCVKDHRAIREWFQEKLIKGGIRGQVQMGAEHSEGLANEVIETLLDTHLIRAEERRRNRWVELAHDRLIEPVQLSNQEWFDKNLHETQKRAALWVTQHRLEALLLSAEELDTHQPWIAENRYTLTAVEQQFLAESEKRRIREQRELEQQTRIRQALSRVFRLDARNYMSDDRRAFALANLALSLRLDPASVTARAWIADLLQKQSWWLEVDIARTFSKPVGVSSLWSGAISPDGTRFLTASVLCQTHSLWDLETRQILSCTGPVVTGDVSPDGSRIIRKPFGNSALELYSASLTAHPDAVLQRLGKSKIAFFSPDGRFVVCVGGGAWVVSDSESGESIGYIKGSVGVRGWPVFSPDGSQILASDSKSITVWDLATGGKVGEPIPFEGDLCSLAFSPDGRLVCWEAGDYSNPGPKTVEIWDFIAGVRRGKPLVHISLDSGLRWNPVISPDGSCIATARTEDIVRINTVNTGASLVPALVHEALVRFVAFSPDGSRILTSSADNLARIWDAATGSLIGSPFPHEVKLDQNCDAATGSPFGSPRPCRYPSFSPDGTRVVTASDDQNAQLWDAFTGEPIGPPLATGGGLGSVSFSADGKFVLTASMLDCAVNLWDAATGECLGSPLLHDSPVSYAHFTRDQRYAITRSIVYVTQVMDVSGHHAIGKLQSHNSQVEWAVFSPGGERFATASALAAEQWDAATGEKIGPPLEHTHDVSTVAYSPDGRLILTTSGDQTAQIWDADTGAKAGPPLLHDHVVRSAAFTPDGQSIVTVAGNAAQLWNTATCQKAGPPLSHESDVWTASLSANGERVVTASADGTAQVWCVATGATVGPPLIHPDRVDNAVFTADGQRVLSFYGGHSAQLWNPATGEPLGRPFVSANRVLSGATLSQQEQLLVTSMQSGNIDVWDLSSGVGVAHKEPNDPSRISSLDITINGLPASFSADESMAVTSTGGGALSVWYAPGTGFAPVGKPINRDWLSLIPDGQIVYSRTEYFGLLRISAWRLSNAQPARRSLLEETPLQGRMFSHAAFTPDGRWIALVNLGEVTIWDAASGKQIGNLISNERSARYVSFSPDGQCLATISAGAKIATLWRMSDGEAIAVLAQDVNGLTFAPDGKSIWTESAAGITVWDANSRAAIRTLLDSWGPVFSRDGTRVVILGKKLVQVLDAATGARVGVPIQEVGGIRGAVLSPDGTRVVTFSQNAARTWDAGTGKPLSPAMEHAGQVECVAFNPTSDRVATASHDGTARIWNAVTGQPFGKSLAHGAKVVRVEFSPDGRCLMTGNDDAPRYYRIWDTATGELIDSFPVDYRWFATFSPDGQTLLVPYEHRSACLHRLLVDSGTPEDTQLLAEFAEAVAGQTASEDGVLTPIDQYAALRRVIEKAETHNGALGAFIRQYIPK